MSPTPEALEEKLRDLGYLNNPIDAFVAAEQPGGTLLGRIVSCGWRAALVIGPLLGALTTVESALLLPGLLHRPDDLAVFGLYQVCLYTAVFFVFGVLWAGAVALVFWLKPRPVGRPELLRRGFELLGGLCIFFYLSFWWTSRAVGVEGASLLENVLATGVFAALSFWVGRYLGLLAYLVVMRLRPETPVPRFPGRSGRFVLAAGVGCVCVFSLALALSEGGSARLSAEATPLIVPTERRDARLALVGVDGLSEELLEALAASGRWPRLAALLRDAARARVDMASASRVPPVLWTTLTTGIRPRGHGVRDFDTRVLYGVSLPLGSRGPALDLFEALQNLLPAFRVLDRLPLSSAERQGKALWEVTAEAGVRSAGLNWWASWPAGKGPALVVSDRVYTRLTAGSSRLAPEGETAPPELLGRLASVPRSTRIPAELDALLLRTFGERARAAAATAHESDAFMRDATLHLLREEQPAFVAVYLRELDVTLRATAAVPGSPLQRASALGQFCELSLTRLDVWLGQLGAQLGDRGSIVLVAIPSAVELEQAPGLHGAVLLSGPEARRPAAAPPLIRVEDLAPTVFSFYGLPLSEELAGKPVDGLLAPEMLARYPHRTVPSYGARQEALAGQQRSSFDARQIEMMRSLGYIE